jgi:hypothetical protein
LSDLRDVLQGCDASITAKAYVEGTASGTNKSGPQPGYFSMKNLRRVALGGVWIVYVILLTFAAAELAGIYLYYDQKGEFIYAGSSRSQSAPADDTTTVRNGPIFVEALLHPYFGFVRRPVPGIVNSAGFNIIGGDVSALCCDLPYTPKKGELVVGIFGGSVAEGMGGILKNEDHLQHALEVDPHFQGKRLKIITFAIAGYKQPQQLIVFAYYLALGQHFDIVINIDGYNELHVPEANELRGLDYTWPVIWWDVARNLDAINLSVDRGAGIEIAYHDLQRARFARAADQCITASCYLIKRILSTYHTWEYQKLSDRFGKDLQKATNFFGEDSHTIDIKEQINAPSSTDPVHFYGAIVDYWARSARIMADLARQHGIIYAHFLQPNQHFVTARRFPSPTPVPADEMPSKVRPIEIGYPFMTEKIKELGREGYNVFDTTKVFDSASTDALYSDNCCHYTSVGNEMFAAVIAQTIIALSKQ